MWKLDPDGFGGFYLYNDPISDMGASAVAVLAAALMIAIPISVMILQPGQFAAAFVSAAIGLCIRFFFGRRGALYFLVPAAFPFFTYAMSASTYAILAGTAGGTQVFALLATIPYAVVVGTALYDLLVGEEEMGLVLGLLFGVPTWVACVRMFFSDTHNPSWLFYVHRISLIVSAIWILVAFFSWLRDKGRLNPKLFVLDLLELAGGFVLLGAASFLTRWANSNLTAGVICLAVFLLYLAAGAFLHIWHSRQKNPPQSMPGLLAAPFLLSCLCYSLPTMAMPFRVEVVSQILDALRRLPGLSSLAWMANDLIFLFQRGLSVALRKIFSLVMLVFDKRVPVFTVPTAIVLLLSLVFVRLAIGLGPVLSARLLKK